MAMASRLLLALVSLLLAARVGDSANILAVAPTYATSHFRMIQPLLRSLVDAGQNVTVVSFYPSAQPHPNYTDISLRSVLPPYSFNCEAWNLIYDIYELFTYGTDTCDVILSSEPVKKLLRSNTTFDLVFLEAFSCDALLGFPAFYKSPYIGFSPTALTPWLADWNWSPIESSFVPDHMCRVASSDTLWERGRRLLCQNAVRIVSWLYNTWPSISLANKHFGLKLHSLDQLKANISVMLVNTIPAIGGTRPYLPNVVEVGGIHLEPHKDLPHELSQWLDNCHDGVVVFSMGSMVQASTLGSDVRDSLVTILGELKECVLWKWEKELSGLPPNIKTVPWLPQYDVLAHPKVRAFVAHGGFHGLVEAIYCGVPIVGIPLYGDQITNLELLKRKGAAEVVALNPFDPGSFKSALKEVLTNASYAENMRQISQITRDFQHSPLDTAIWWTEYTLRHRGASHWRHDGVKLTWWQLLMWDVYFAAGISLGFLWLLLQISLKMLRIRCEG